MPLFFMLLAIRYGRKGNNMEKILNLYDFMSREYLGHLYNQGYRPKYLPNGIKELILNGADKEVVAKWIAMNMTDTLFDDEIQREIRENGVSLSEAQIIEAAREDSICVYEWMRKESVGNFMAFINNSTNPNETFSELEKIFNNEIMEELFFFRTVTREEVEEYPFFWKAVAVRFIKNYYKKEGMREDFLHVLEILKWLNMDEQDYKIILNHCREWLDKVCSDIYFNKDERNLMASFIQFATV